MADEFSELDNFLRKVPKVYGVEFLRKTGFHISGPDVPISLWHWKPYDPEAIAAPLENNSPEVVTNCYPKKFRQRVVLLLGGDFDISSDDILVGLRRQGVKFFKINWEYLAREGQITLLAGKPQKGWLKVQSIKLDLRDVAAVYYQEPRLVWVGTTPYWKVRKFGLHEALWISRWRLALHQLWAFTPGALWVPSVPQVYGEPNQQKLAELNLAVECGLKVPETLYTNSLREARTFLRGGKTIFRDFSRRQVLYRGKSHVFEVNFASHRSRQFSRVCSSPVIFQRFIDKECDVRAIYVGGRILACRINSQASEWTRLDWRLYDNVRVSWEKMKLPRSVEAGMRQLAKRLGLEMGSFDLVKGKGGGYYFLEVNRPGAYKWLRDFAGIDAASEIARYLAKTARG